MCTLTESSIQYTLASLSECDDSNLNLHTLMQALTRTMYLAFPELLKFLLCSGILFIAFAMTGWIVLGPFHGKFEDLNSAIETLFGLLNGDDIYNTFIQVRPQDDLTAYVFSRIFLYVFLALFIYAVLNLFTSLIITAYEASQVLKEAILE